jgi:hypothetical protein
MRNDDDGRVCFFVERMERLRQALKAPQVDARLRLVKQRDLQVRARMLAISMRLSSPPEKLALISRLI